ncbi:membrane protein [Cupriavidus sp. SK-3]|nr:membrane protein [Cupriavidus sp. SK-3]
MQPVYAYLIYILASFAMLGLFLLVYTRITPHREFELIRQGNVAAALSLGGAVLGFSLTLSASIQHNTAFSMFVLWGFGAFVVQVLAYVLVARALHGVSEQITADNRGMGALMGVVSLSAGIVNAACLA